MISEKFEAFRASLLVKKGAISVFGDDKMAKQGIRNEYVKRSPELQFYAMAKRGNRQ